MGEYASRMVNGKIEQVCKVGTCDDWRYVRRCEAERLSIGDMRQGTNMDSALAEPSILYRFPFPDEDLPFGHFEGYDLSAINQRSMFRALSLRVSETALRSMDHRHISERLKNGDWPGAGVNVAVPCPWSARFDALQLAHSPLTPLATLYGERYADGIGRTIFACGFCEAPFSLDEAELATVDAIDPKIQSRLRARP